MNIEEIKLYFFQNKKAHDGEVVGLVSYLGFNETRLDLSKYTFMRQVYFIPTNIEGGLGISPLQYFQRCKQ